MNLKKRGFDLAVDSVPLELALTGCSSKGATSAPAVTPAGLHTAGQDGLATAQQMIDEVMTEPRQISRTVSCGTSTCDGTVFPEIDNFQEQYLALWGVS